MPVSIDDLRLFGAQESTNEVSAKIDVTSAPSQTDEEAFVFGLRAAETNPLSGRVTAIRLASNPDYPLDEREALSDWLQRFESLVSAEQGTGFELVDEERDRSINVIVTTASHTISYGEPFEASWSLDIERGEGVLTDATRSPTSATPNSTETLGGTDLGTITEKQTEKQIDVETSPIAFADTSDTVITPNSGVIRQVTIAGRVGGTLTELRSFDETLRDYVGREDTLSYQTAMPGTTHDVLVDSYDSTLSAGSPNVLRYGLTLFAGLTFE